jgi:hypothetical protein
VHADFKPGNVYVAPNNTPKILDFGIARAVQLSETQGEDTLFDPARLAALTPAYASREMLAGDNPEPRDDLYSLGIVIYLVLTGHHPFGRMSAVDAAREDLKPEKPKGISRRQWQVINRCLAFNRQDRPQDIAEVEKYLLTPSPWRTRSLLVAAAVLLLALSVNYLIGDAELSEVKQEVRQSTLLDAQVERLTALLEEPVFDQNWEQRLASEFDALGVLDAKGDDQTRLAGQIRGAYATHIVAVEDIDAAIGLIERGSTYGDLSASARQVEDKAFMRVRHLLDGARADQVWLEDLKVEVSRVRGSFPGSTELVELDLEISEVLEMLVREALVANHIVEAQQILAELSPRLFDVLTLDDLRREVDEADAKALAQREARQVAIRKRSQAMELDEVLAASCLHMDVARIHALAGEDLTDPVLNDKVTSRLSSCLAQLAELDQDRALGLHRAIEAEFGEVFEMSDVSVDPCSLSYLVGNGALAGLRGYCADQLAGEIQGPRLVVVPAEDGLRRFAMTRQEISWSQFRKFCVEQDGCSEVELELVEIDDRMPVTGVSLDTVRAFARWMSETSGYVYRLPTRTEWLWAARGEPDPNRNCRVQLDGVQRGIAPVAAASGQSNDYGLLNMLGNVQEWVLDGEKIVAVGGSFSDPIGVCIAGTERTHGGEAALDTGFRLVREVS